MISLDIALHRPRPRLDRIAKREVAESVHIPYACHYDSDTLLTKQEHLAQVLHITGIPFETADDALLVLRKNLRNALVRSAADSRFAMYVHTIRSKKSFYPDGEFDPGFAAELDQRWREKNLSTQTFTNDTYVTLLRKAPGVSRGARRWLDRVCHKDHRTERQVALRLAHKELVAISRRFLASLQEYRPRILRLNRHDGWTYSEPAQFLGRLINLEDRPVLLPAMDLSK